MFVLRSAFLIALLIISMGNVHGTTLQVEITGVANIPDLNIIIYAELFPNSDQQVQRLNFVQKFDQDRARNGAFNVTFDFEPPEHDFSVFIYGRIQDSLQDQIGYIPLKAINKSDPNDAKLFENPRLIQIAIHAQAHREAAFQMSFPFGYGTHKDFIRSENIDTVLHSLIILIDNGFVDGKQNGTTSWKQVYEFFMENAAFFSRGHSSHLERVAFYLVTLSRIEPSRDFHRFYVQFLTATNKLRVGGREIGHQTLDMHLFGEIRRLYAERLDTETLKEMQNSLSGYFELYDYEKCLSLATVMFKNLSAHEDLLEIIGQDENLKRQVKSAILVATDCQQYFFVNESAAGGAMRNDTSGAAKFLNETEHGREFLIAFWGLFRALERKYVISTGEENVEVLRNFALIYRALLTPQHGAVIQLNRLFS